MAKLFFVPAFSTLCERNLCDGTGVLTVDGEDITCNCRAGIALEADLKADSRPLDLAVIAEDPEVDKFERSRALGAPVWLGLDLSDVGDEALSVEAV